MTCIAAASFNSHVGPRAEDDEFRHSTSGEVSSDGMPCLVQKNTNQAGRKAHERRPYPH